MRSLLRLLTASALAFLCFIAFDMFSINILKDFSTESNINSDVVYICAGIVLAVIFYFTIALLIVKLVLHKIKKTEENFSAMHITELLCGSVGCVVGLVMGNLICSPIWNTPFENLIKICVCVLLGLFGFNIGRKRKDDIPGLKNSSYDFNGKPKILDTSVIIDGRILDILKTGFVEGKVIIPNFVLEELRHIADSADSLKRNRGRLGLDILNQIQNEATVHVEIYDYDVSSRMDVDDKLLKMASELDAFVVTNDYNLNKVAEFQRVSVLNINELSNAVKSIVLPGQEMRVNVIKDGKEIGQGVAYLNDGTMIVVENGRKYIGEDIFVQVTSVLQTAAGRMIFAKPLDE